MKRNTKKHAIHQYACILFLIVLAAVCTLAPFATTRQEKKEDGTNTLVKSPSCPIPPLSSEWNESLLLEACTRYYGRSKAPSSLDMVLLKDSLMIPGDKDEFGNPSDYPSLAAIVQRLIDMGGVFSSDSPTAVNLGARDGIGTMGNTDPTWPLFSEMGFGGIAVEASTAFQMELKRNFAGLKAKPIMATITQWNAVSIIRNAGLERVDVLKIDIDSWDCEVLPRVLREADFGIKVVLVKYNVKFPPPIKMNLATCPQSAFRSCARYHVYECSLQYMNDDVMVPAGYALAQVDWQNALYVHRSIASNLGIPSGGINLAAAYRQGYAERKDRAKNMPWNHDIDHLLSAANPAETMQLVLSYIRGGHHQQDGLVLIGCGDVSRLVPYRRSASIDDATGRVGEC